MEVFFMLTDAERALFLRLEEDYKLLERNYRHKLVNEEDYNKWVNYIKNEINTLLG